MNYQEANALISRLNTFFPHFAGRNPEAKQGYIEKIIKFEYDRAQVAVETIINTSTASKGPSVAELLSAMMQTKIADSWRENCKTCDSTGWIFTTQTIDGREHEAVKDCSCLVRRPEVKSAGPAGYQEGVPGWIESLRNHDKVERKRISVVEEDPEIF